MRSHTNPIPATLAGFDVAPGLLVLERVRLDGSSHLLELHDGDEIGVALHPEMPPWPHLILSRIGRNGSLVRVCPPGAGALARDIPARVVCEAWLGVNRPV